MDKFEKKSRELVEFIQASPSPYHVISNITAIFDKAGLERVDETNIWKLKKGKKYYTVRNNSSLIAFSIPKNSPSNYQIVASHSDSPTFKIKENPELKKAGHYIELNIEKYGGMILNSWFDRPLSIAGRVAAEKDGAIKELLVNFDRDLLMIPSLAIHMNRQANEGSSIRVQTDMLPILGDESTEGKFNKLIAKELNLKADNILGTDLFLYDRSRASFWGANNEYFSCQKLDDLLCAFSSVNAFLSSKNDNSVNICAIFDNEEVGSSSKQGADSSFLTETVLRISEGLELSRQKHFAMIANGFMISADNGHAVHPNHIDKADPSNQPYMNGGIVIKYNANQKYTTDSISAAVFKMICKKNKIPYQVYVNNSDIAGGSTLGNISNSHLSLNTIDIGAAQLAMHSAYETAGVKDCYYLEAAIKAFYDSNISRNSKGEYTI